nr:hypothetical protein [Tanacetum cinerariifolium]
TDDILVRLLRANTLDLSAGKVTQADRTVTTSNELDLLFSPMFDELLNGSSKVVSKSSAVSAADASNQQTYAENDQVVDDKFINIFSNPVQDQGETSTRHVNSSNMHTFYQRCPLSLHQREGQKRKVSVSRQMTWYEMFDSSRTGGSGK